MHNYAAKLLAEREHLTELATETADKAAAENRDLTDTENELIKGWQERSAKIDADLDVARSHMESTRSYRELQHRLGELDAPDGGGSARERRNGRVVVEARSWGDTFLEAEQFKDWHGGRGAPVTMPTGLLEQRAAADPIMVGDLPVAPSIYTPREPRVDTPFLNAVSRERVSSGSVEYVRWQPTGIANAGPGAPTAEGQLKPPADITLTEKSVTLQTFAWYKAITRQALEDYPRIRSIVEGFLRQGLMHTLENGMAAAVTGDTDIPSVGQATDALAGSIRVAMAQVEINGFTPNAVLVNPQDSAALDIVTAILAREAPGVQRSFWGLTPIPAVAIPAGTAYVGDLAAALTIFDRGTTAVYLSDSHQDYFLRNMLVILAETRAFPAVVQPAAMCQAVGAAGTCLECTPAGGTPGEVSAPSIVLPASLGTTTTSTSTTTTPPA